MGQGLRVAITGIPNAGKSTLFNSLLKAKRAIVTDEAGTTRDFIEERCLIRGRLITLIDTAGIRKDASKIEKLGIELAEELISSADLALHLIPSDLNENQAKAIQKEIENLNPGHVVHLLTKCDMNRPKWATDLLHVSSLTQEGLTDLQKYLVEMVDKSFLNVSEQVFVSSERHKTSLKQALSSIEVFLSEYAKQSSYDECLAFELQQAKKHLASIIGEIDSEDILGKIFESFCIGK
jgi:tRNA modification GTPase